MYPWMDTITGMHPGCEHQGKPLLPMREKLHALLGVFVAQDSLTETRDYRQYDKVLHTIYFLATTKKISSRDSWSTLLDS